MTYLQRDMADPVNASAWRARIQDNTTHHDPAYYGAHYDVEPTPGTTHLSGERDAVAKKGCCCLFGCYIVFCFSGGRGGEISIGSLSSAIHFVTMD